jgi:hypothetical protein
VDAAGTFTVRSWYFNGNSSPFAGILFVCC